MMRAIVRQGPSVRLRRMPVPSPEPGEILVQVMVAGLCRTDVHAADPDGHAEPVVLGHEFAGVVAELGDEVTGFAVGDRVAVTPMLPCLRCARCAGGAPERCPHAELLGVRRHGAFCEFVAVPAHVVHRIPEALTFREGAYAGPVCASLAVAQADIKPPDHGLVHGGNRLARLTAHILRAYGFHAVDVRGTEKSAAATACLTRVPADTYDFAVESAPSAAVIGELIRVVRPGGRIVLRSRPSGPVEIDLGAAIGKEITFETVAYSTFREALSFLVQEHERIADLLGCVRPLEDFEDLFSAERESQRFKSFFCPNFADIGPAEIEAWARLMHPQAPRS
ncbi:zinc-binding dehydrogenase [Streptomyces sp. NPDC048172]|uniref:zinc-dependent alcohol dehydrogenase n=1 Tax=Streptomyces sp. NPDC048172 TaxID=3365505 RepID=UPI0037137DD2